jgi:hypothetical protein
MVLLSMRRASTSSWLCLAPYNDQTYADKCGQLADARLQSGCHPERGKGSAFLVLSGAVRQCSRTSDRSDER